MTTENSEHTTTLRNRDQECLYFEFLDRYRFLEFYDLDFIYDSLKLKEFKIF